MATAGGRWALAALAVVLVVGTRCARALAEEAAPPAKRLNVLFIISDDMNTHLGCYGDGVVKTPNLDALAARGVRFANAYCQFPVCNPSRTSFLTGMYPETTGILAQPLFLRKDGKTSNAIYLPDYFKANGYFTAGIGKVEHAGHTEIQWNVGDTMLAGGARGDDDEGESPASQPASRSAAGAGRRGNRPPRATPRKTPDDLPYTIARATADDDPENVDTPIAARVSKLLEEKKEQPFFIVAGFHKPHVPHVAPKKYFDLYPVDSIVPTLVPADDERDIPQAALASKKNYQPDMPTKTKQEIIASYYACTTYFDAEVGEVMKTMDRLNLWDKTIVVMIGDHGWHFGEHNWWAKASLFEESCHAPMMIASPGVKPGVSPRVVEFLDIAPTITSLCGLAPLPQHQGKRITPLLNDPKAEWDGSGYTVLGSRGRTIRTERYRYTEWDHGKAGAELYDHESDPNELTNLAKDPGHANTVTQMKKALAERAEKARTAATHASS